MKDALGYYAILDVDFSADDKLIKSQYRDLAKIWHPDSNKTKEAIEHFQKLSVAYDVLKNEKTRLMYDLLSEVYAKDVFPDMHNLSILKDKYNQETPLIRVISLSKVVGKIIKYSSTKERLICTYEQAKHEVLRYSLFNWFCGWWHPKAFVLNIRAIVGNIRNIGYNRDDNLMLLIHNALAYQQDGKSRQAMVSALQALEYADTYQQKLLNRFISDLDVPRSVKIPAWRVGPLKAWQFVVPFLLLLTASYPIVQRFAWNRYINKENAVTYFQKVQLNSGGEIMDDVVVSKIFSIPVDVTDGDKLYHLAKQTDIMYGPDSKFDVKNVGNQGQTVRVTGFTPDKSWYRIMIDNGEMGFVPAKALRRGVGTLPPSGSKIIPSAL